MRSTYLCKLLPEDEDRLLMTHTGDTSYDEQSMRSPERDKDRCLKTKLWLILPCEGVVH